MKTKRILLLSLAAIFTVFLFLPVLSVPARAAAEYVIDDAGVLTEEELQKLNGTLAEISERHKLDVAVAIVNSNSGGRTIMDAKEIYDTAGLGQGGDKSGLLLVQDSAKQTFAFARYGSAEVVFTQAALNYVSSNIVEYLWQGDYFGASLAYAEGCDDFLNIYEARTPYVNNDSKEDTPNNTPDISNNYNINGATIAASLFFSVIIALILTAPYLG
ncbi:MAG: TPM domain-containing protein [Oscillospiraceae bacterium]|jgi:uncharacterized protein|nr:TPM domain-containing protein [Oscillospiraceae bacterium]